MRPVTRHRLFQFEAKDGGTVGTVAPTHFYLYILLSAPTLKKIFRRPCIELSGEFKQEYPLVTPLRYFLPFGYDRRAILKLAFPNYIRYNVN